MIAVDFTRTAESVAKTGADLAKWAKRQETKVRKLFRCMSICCLLILADVDVDVIRSPLIVVRAGGSRCALYAASASDVYQ